MALQDVKEYYVKVLGQYVELKNDLTDFEKALKDGYITEDKLQSAVEDVERVKENVDRIAYILFLFNLPKRKDKKIKYKKNNEPLAEYFKELKADKDSVIDENIDLMTLVREELKKLEENK